MPVEAIKELMWAADERYEEYKQEHCPHSDMDKNDSVCPDCFKVLEAPDYDTMAKIADGF